MARSKGTQMASPKVAGRIITVDRLFRPCTKETVRDQVFYLRVLSDGELNLRDLAASAAGHRVVKALNTPGTLEHDTLIKPLQEAQRADLVETVLSVREVTLKIEIAREIRPLFHPHSGEPDVTGEEDRAVQDKRQEERIATASARQARFDELFPVHKAEVEQMSDEVLRAEALRAQENAQARLAYIREARDQLAYLSTFRDLDHRERYFDNIEEARALNPKVKERLEAAYEEIDLADIYEIKN